MLLLFPVVMSLLLTGCGFHLRGAVPLPAVMEKTHVVGAGGSELYYAVENALLEAGAELVDSPAAATAVLTLHSQRLARRVLSVDAQGRAAEYELALLVVFSLQDASGELIADGEQISVIRDFSFDPDNVLAKDEEEASLRSEMYRYAVAQLLRRLQSRARQKG